jgi:hypothetical protein
MGSKTWNETLAAIENEQDKAKTAMLNNAMFNAQDYQNNILGQAETAGSMVIDPQLIAGAQGAGLENTYDKKWQNKQDNYKTQMARYNANVKAIVNPISNFGGQALGSYAAGSGK